MLTLPFLYIFRRTLIGAAIPISFIGNVHMTSVDNIHSYGSIYINIITLYKFRFYISYFLQCNNYPDSDKPLRHQQSKLNSNNVHS